jgi:hypothetical protein
MLLNFTNQMFSKLFQNENKFPEHNNRYKDLEIKWVAIALQFIRAFLYKHDHNSFVDNTNQQIEK